MSDHSDIASRYPPPNSFAVILGTNEIASAIAAYPAGRATAKAVMRAIQSWTAPSEERASVVSQART